MRWKKANQNKRRAMLRAQRAKAAKKKLFTTTGWRDWLKALGPGFWEPYVYQETILDSFWERAREMSASYPFNRRISLPQLSMPQPTAEGEAVCVSGGFRGYLPAFIIVDEAEVCNGCGAPTRL